MVMQEARKQHQTATTSIWAWKEIQGKGLPFTEMQQVCKHLAEANEAQTSRQISMSLGIERTNVCRALNEMEKLGVAEVLHKNPCKITGHRAKHYQIKKEAN